MAGLGKRVSVGLGGLALTFGAGYGVGSTTAKHPDTIPNLKAQVQNDVGAEDGVSFQLPFKIDESDPLASE